MKKLLIVLKMSLCIVSVKAQNGDYSQIKDSINIKLNCAPIRYNPKILSSPNPKSIHPDWKGSEVGTSWSFFTTKKIKNKDGVFLFGNLISPRGGVITKGCYIIYSEWKCSK
jgi:hypothetical protein